MHYTQRPAFRSGPEATLFLIICRRRQHLQWKQAPSFLT